MLEFICIVRPVEQKGGSMKYITASQAAEKWHISQRRVQILCSEGRIDGVFKLGENWAIPEDSEKPLDGRTKKEIKENENS